MNNSNIIDDIIQTSLEYYDSFQPKIIEIVEKIHYVKFKNNKNITDEIIFYDKNKKEILKSSYEILAAFLPNQQIWKWAWSLPTILKKNSFISRKILEYALNLDHQKDYLLKSTLINSKIRIINDLQLDIYIALSANLSRKPFILKLYLAPLAPLAPYQHDQDNYYYPYKKISDDPDNSKYMVYYLFILDYN